MRGELLVNPSREHGIVRIDCGDKLQDHHPNVLRLMARWEDRELMAEFTGVILYPALEKMVGESEPRRREQRDTLYKNHYKTLITSSAKRGTMFRHPLRAVLEALRQDFALGAVAPPERDNGFSRSLETELEIEADESSPTMPGGLR